MAYQCFLDAVRVDWGDISSTTVLIRGWKFDGALTAAGSRECLVSLDADVMDGGEEVAALAVGTHLTELGIRQACHGWMIAAVIKYIKEHIIPNRLFFTVTMDIVEATPAVTAADIDEALYLYLADTVAPASEAEIAEMEKFQLCGAEQDENLCCVICMDEGDGFALMPCNHVFHVTCAARWFRINPLCPLCRRRYSKPE
uniref:RING-type E3 ubiquitin transferase n=1 Tax=Kalanchoe fedtschenkoi TaxID=63787 RepID=A0A7N0T313_KALFE